MSAMSNLDGQPLKVGGLFAGYGGIELALQSVLNTEPAWFCEFDKAPSKILAHHWPTVPNFGDVTKVDWAAVERVDIITGGSPCQDLSHAGKRAGMKAGTRSGLWASMCDAIEAIRPKLVIWENVRGSLSAEADSAMEPCPRCVGDPRDRGPVLRALGRVLGDLSEIGYDAWWYGLPASDLGAAHERFRVFVFATPANSDHSGLEGRPTSGERGGEQPVGQGGVAPGATLTLLPSPRTSDTNGPGAHGDGGPDLRTVVSTLPQHDWLEYADAIHRQEATFGRPAPLPTSPDGRGGKHRLSPIFSEWLMGLPAGHVTDPAIGISRNDQLKALGNGVVPQQAAAALRAFLADTTKAVA